MTEQISEREERLAKILKHILSDKGVFFIYGEAGEHDKMGLPDKILVCPTNGLDGFAVYKKEREYSVKGT
jgi:hypothetical protein